MKNIYLLNRLIVAVSMLIITACSYNKSVSSDQSGENTAGIDTTMDANSGGNMSSEKNSNNIQIRHLHQNNTIYFDLDKYNIRSEFIKILDTHAYFLRNNTSYKVIIEGHADERGTPEYNISLGERRANAIKMYLQGRGVSVDQISIVSYGKEKPAVFGHDEIAYAKNRRAVLIY